MSTKAVEKEDFFLALPAEVPELALTRHTLMMCSSQNQFLKPEGNTREGTCLGHRPPLGLGEYT